MGGFQKELDLNLKFLDNDIYQNLLPIIKTIQTGEVKINIWDIPYSIGKLSYLVHSHYRYYGKFPSVVAGQILKQYPPKNPKNDFMLDNFCGSGTSLVESKLRGINSIGIDISWLSILASKVKVSEVNFEYLEDELQNLIRSFKEKSHLFEDLPIDYFCSKWFSNKVAFELTIIKDYLIGMNYSPERDFLIVAFIAIVRRVSLAFDGEVRPHINRTKRPRDVLSAYIKKTNDMVKNQKSFNDLCPSNTIEKTFLGDNLNLSKIKYLHDKNIYLVISHPPYLNSFNYSPVYNLEFYWGKYFENEYVDKEKISLHKTELKAHPANEIIQNKYFEHLKKCYEETYSIQEKDGKLAIVIGDCSRNKKHIPVINRLIDIVKLIGYELVEINYRTTHYGLGKYAYNHRADYHGNNEEKRDAIIIFKK
ncbi:DNA methyltransferase [Prochlorococcus sp. MIT 1223]|uniref:DNA methyltransferase n=1 Tax=Prochlorococcus sp. MIT 1223 TaxID=3096217 RepID=UPI002A760DAF|nr:DNA methyltransferase [Prochlorococcus sp. MIT 1223]